MAKITESKLASDFVKLHRALEALDALTARLKERGLWRTLRAGNQHDKKLIQKYFRVRNAASAIVNALSDAIEN